MNFKINLRPYPAAEYFTVKEHLRLFDQSKSDAEELLSKIEVALKNILNIPEGFRIVFMKRAQLKDLLMNTKIKDDPGTGIDLLLEEDFIWTEDLILDISYSFPHFPSRLQGSVLIDPAVSLGVPCDFLILIANKELPIEETILYHGEEVNFVYTIDKVINDYLNKGLDVLIRESKYKAAVLYQLIEDSAYLTAVADKSTRSGTVILAACEPSLISKIEKLGYDMGLAAHNGESALAIANYPTHSKELIEMFADRVLAV